MTDTASTRNTESTAEEGLRQLYELCEQRNRLSATLTNEYGTSEVVITAVDVEDKRVYADNWMGAVQCLRAEQISDVRVVVAEPVVAE